jgi:multiple sugar transport system permease protein
MSRELEESVISTAHAVPRLLPGDAAAGVSGHDLGGDALLIFAFRMNICSLILTGTTVKTFPVHIPTFTLGSQTLWNLVMAFSLVAMLPPVILFIILRRYMVRGLSLGVVKG